MIGHWVQVDAGKLGALLEDGEHLEVEAMSYHLMIKLGA